MKKVRFIQLPLLVDHSQTLYHPWKQHIIQQNHHVYQTFVIIVKVKISWQTTMP